MANLLLLALCMAAGVLLRKTGRFPAATPSALNGFVIHLSLPAATILHIHRLRIAPELVAAALSPWIVVLGAIPFFLWVGRAMELPRKTVGALILLGGLGNTSFVGLPMIETWYGKEWIGVGIVADQAGSFLALSTVGLAVAFRYSSGEATWRQMTRRVLLFPPFQALVAALLLRPVPFPAVAESVLQRLADTITPLALVSVGFQLRLSGSGSVWKPLSAGLAWKLLLAPAAAAALFFGVFGLGGTEVRVAVFEAAMAPMITAGIIASEHDLDPPLVAMMLGIGIPLSFLTLGGWWWVLGRM
jgi:predicted permease